MVMSTSIYGAGDWERLGLNNNPFRDKIVDNGLSAAFIQQSIIKQCEDIQPLHVFTGNSGIGKTMHAKYLAKHFLKNKRRPTQMITASKTIKASGLLKMVCCRFNIELPGGDMLDEAKIDTIRRMIFKRKEGLSLIIDDAHHLGEDALYAILRLTALQREPYKLQVVLFGSPAMLEPIKKMWADFDLGFSYIQSSINAWTQEQTESYILSRLRDSGLATSSQVCQKTCQKIYQLSGGIPMQINRRANMMLDRLIKGREKKTATTLAINGRILWFGALVSALSAGYFSYQAVNEQRAWKIDDTQVAMYTSAQGARVEDMLLQQTLSSVEHSSTGESSTDVGSEVLMTSIDEVSVDGSSVDEVLVGEQSVNDGINLMLEDVAEPLSALEVHESSETTQALDDEWLEDEGYTIQVVATTDLSEAQRIAAKFDQSHVVHVARQNQEKYLVVVGHYDDLQSAREGVVTQFSSDESQPWVRKLSAVKEDVAKLDEIV